jgi:hypothetical protein
VPVFLLFRTYAVASLSRGLLPSTIARDILRLYSLSRQRADTKAVFASMVVKRMIRFTTVRACRVYAASSGEGASFSRRCVGPKGRLFVDMLRQ